MEDWSFNKVTLEHTFLSEFILSFMLISLILREII